MAFTNVIIQGSNKKKLMIVSLILLIYYYFVYYSKNKQITSSEIETFLGNSIFFIALQNTPFILL